MTTSRVSIRTSYAGRTSHLQRGIDPSPFEGFIPPFGRLDLDQYDNGADGTARHDCRPLPRQSLCPHYHTPRLSVHDVGTRIRFKGAQSRTQTPNPNPQSNLKATRFSQTTQLTSPLKQPPQRLWRPALIGGELASCHWEESDQCCSPTECRGSKGGMAKEQVQMAHRAGRH